MVTSGTSSRLDERSQKILENPSKPGSENRKGNAPTASFPLPSEQSGGKDSRNFLRQPSSRRPPFAPVGRERAKILGISGKGFEQVFTSASRVGTTRRPPARLGVRESRNFQAAAVASRKWIACSWLRTPSLRRRGWETSETTPKSARLEDRRRPAARACTQLRRRP